jgi:hypothetical protein
MAEPVIEQIAQWIESALDGMQDPDATLTLRAVRPKILDWTMQDFKHGDVIIEANSIATQSRTLCESRTELAMFKCYGIIRTLPADTAADTVLTRMTETIRRLLMDGNIGGKACGGLAMNIDCPSSSFDVMDGGAIADIDVQIMYKTALWDGYQ